MSISRLGCPTSQTRDVKIPGDDFSDGIGSSIFNAKTIQEIITPPEASHHDFKTGSSVGASLHHQQGLVVRGKSATNLACLVDGAKGSTKGEKEDIVDYSVVPVAVQAGSASFDFVRLHPASTGIIAAGHAALESELKTEVFQRNPAASWRVEESRGEVRLLHTALHFTDPHLLVIQRGERSAAPLRDESKTITVGLEIRKKQKIEGDIQQSHPGGMTSGEATIVSGLLPLENANAPQYQNEQQHRSNGRGARTHTNISGDVRSAAIRAGSLNNEIDPSIPRESSALPTPLFERLVTEEVQELKAYVRIVENQNRRLAELERVHGDLEARLEVESKGRQHLEATLEAREREWAEKLEHLESDRDQWMRLVEAEKSKNSKLIDQVVRKDQDIHRMLQRKVRAVLLASMRSYFHSLLLIFFSFALVQYDHEITRSTRSARPTAPEQRDKPRGPSAASSKPPDFMNDSTVHKGPHQILAAAGSAEKVRNRNAKSLLMDFFGM